MGNNNITTKKARMTGADVKMHFLRVGLALLLLSGIKQVLQMTIASLFATYLPDVYHTWYFLWLLSFLPLYLVAFPIYYIILPKKPDIPPLAEPEGGNTGARVLTVLCIPVALASLIILNSVGYYFVELLGIISGGAISNTNSLDGIINSSPVYVTILGACVLAPALEELTFRKLLVDRVLPFGEAGACLLSGVMFGLFHGNFRQFFYTAALGTIFAFIYSRTGKIIIPILIHAGLNLLGTVVTPWALADDKVGELTVAFGGNGSLGFGGTVAGLTFVFGAVALIAGIVCAVLLARRVRFRAGSVSVPLSVGWFNPAVICAAVFMFMIFIIALI